MAPHTISHTPARVVSPIEFLGVSPHDTPLGPQLNGNSSKAETLPSNANVVTSFGLEPRGTAPHLRFQRPLATEQPRPMTPHCPAPTQQPRASLAADLWRCLAQHGSEVRDLGLAAVLLGAVYVAAPSAVAALFAGPALLTAAYASAAFLLVYWFCAGGEALKRTSVGLLVGALTAAILIPGATPAALLVGAIAGGLIAYNYDGWQNLIIPVGVAAILFLAQQILHS